MTLLTELKELLKNGIEVKLVGEKLKVEAMPGALKAEQIALLKQQKENILRLFHSLTIKSNRDYEFLSFAQQRLWLLDQIDGGSHQYNMPMALKLSGVFDERAMQRAFADIMERHESLRTCFVAADDGEPVQIIKEKSGFDVPLTDLSALPKEVQQTQIDQAASAEAEAIFDLSWDFMVRARVLKLSSQEHILLVTMHHIASDGWSMGILVNEFSRLYSAYVQGEESPLTPLAIQYADYANWQREWLQSNKLDEQLAYWQDKLSGLPALHNLPLDKPRPLAQGFSGETYVSCIAKTELASLKKICQTREATLFMGLHAAFSVLLSRYSNEKDIVVGTPVANREQMEVADLIGFFVNTLVLRCDLSGEPRFFDVLAQSKQMLLDAYAHQQVPFEQVVERLQPERSLSHSPLFQVMLALQNNEQGNLSLPGISLSQLNLNQGDVSQFDLTLNVAEKPDGLTLSWVFNTDLFERDTIARMAEHFEVLLSALVQAPEQDVFSHELATAQEREQLLGRWNNTEVEVPLEYCLHELFAEQADRFPKKAALVCDGMSLSYGELNRRANQLAHYLKAQGVKAQTLVGLCVERSVDMVVGILGILKAGGAYVPLDPAYPQARLAYMLSDTNVALVLAQQSVLKQLPVFDGQVICLDDEALQAELMTMPVQSLIVSGLTPSHLAYVIYTSGSTGQPKGVMVAHESVTAFAVNNRYVAVSEVEHVASLSSYAFDGFVFDLFFSLLNGKTVSLLGKNHILDSGSFKSALTANGIDTFFTTTALFNQMILNDTLGDSGVKNVLFGGEKADPGLVERAVQRYPSIAFIHVYGPTETTVFASAHHFGDEVDPAIPIGKPLHNKQCYVLDAALNPVPVGVVGELYIGGLGLARGYLNRPALTAEKFVINPFYDEKNSRSSKQLYRTGDLVRWLANGSLVFIARADHQVKVRGFRIELGEIEHALTGQSEIKEAVVLAREIGDNNTQLVAYLVSSEAGQQDAELIEQVRGHLRQVLPDYMVPAAFVVLDALPLSANGKVNRHALPEPDMEALRAEYIAPQTETEIRLSEIWQQLLGIASVGLGDNFFDLGGHSLLATKLVVRCSEAFEVTLPLREIFNQPKLAALAAFIDSCDRGLQGPPLLPVSREQALPLSYAQQRLWLLDKIDGGSTHYNMPAALKLTGTLNQDALKQAFSAIVVRHESLRTCFIGGDDGEPIQVLQEADTFDIPFTDLSTLTTGIREAEIAEVIAKEAVSAFDLSQDLMLRTRLLKVSDLEHILLVTMHHIASDGWSMGILVNEFSQLYRAYVQGEEASLAPLAIQYGDYAYWQRQWLQGDVLEQQLDYWQNQLSYLPVVHSLPLDYARPMVQSFTGDVHASSLDKNDVARLTALCQSHGATLFMGLHAAFSVLLSRYSNEQDIVVGTPVANREQSEIAELIGFFVNTLVLRSDLSGSPSFHDLLGQSKRCLLDAYDHQQVPFEQIVDRLQPERSLSHSPLFQVMLSLQNNDQGSLSLPGLELSMVEGGGQTAKFDLTLNMAEEAGGLGLYWEFNTAVFKDETIVRMAEHFEVLLSALLQSPERDVFSHELVTSREREQLLASSQDIECLTPSRSCLHELFEEQAARHPEKIALVYEASRLSYGELNRRANQLARYLTAQGVKPDTLVGLCVERSLETVVGMLAILKAGGAYVPLDPANPQSRLTYMLEDSGVQTVLTSQAVLAQLPVLADKALCLDDEAVQAQLSDMSVQNLSVSSLGLASHHLAYVIYTSGSTGQPKGVLVQHNNVTRLLGTSQAHFDFSEADVWTLFHSYAFDFSVWEIWGALAYGGRLVIVPYWVSRSSGDFYQLLVQEKVTVLNQTPSAFNLLIAEDSRRDEPLALRYVVFGGEALNFTQLKPWVARHGDNTPELVNMYGITETTVHVTYRRIREQDLTQGRGASLIGKPLADLDILLLNEKQVLVPDGIGGEMYVSGHGVSRGYLNREELSAERFVCLPGQGVKRFYRTGDLARRQEGGELEYLGRIDHQVKVRGFRIELGEIEHALATHSDIQEALVLARDNGENNSQLVAYLVVDDSERETGALIEDVKGHIRQALPEYMVPSAYMILEALPLTANGKVNVKALPEPDIGLSRAEYVAPKSDTERALCSIWQQVLEVERVGIMDNFFQLGGHSLLATKLVVRINSELNANIQVKDIFALSTVRELSRSLAIGQPGIVQQQLEQGLQEIDKFRHNIENHAVLKQQLPDDCETLFPLSAIQQSMVYFAQTQPEVPIYHDQFPFVLEWVDFDLALFNQAFEYICQAHSILRTSFAVNGFDEPVQFVHRKSQLNIGIEDISDAAPDIQKQQIEDYCRKDLNNKFTFKVNELLWRVKLFSLSSGRVCIILTVQHAILDGWSLNLMVSELLANYARLKDGHRDLIPAPESTYRDYVAINLYRSCSDQTQVFWKDYLQNYNRMKLPFNYAGKPISSSKMMTAVKGEVDASLLRKLQQLTQSKGYTIKEICLAAHVYLLSLITGDSEILTGVVTHNRPEIKDTDRVLGCFLNTIPLRLSAHTSINKHVLITQVRDFLRQVKAHEIFLADIARLAGENDANGNPLFDVIFNFTDFPELMPAAESNMLINSEKELFAINGSEMTNTKFDLEVHKNGQHGMAIQIKYSEEYFDAKEVELALNLYLQILELMASSEAQLCSTDLVESVGTKNTQFNETDKAYAYTKTMHALFEEQVVKAPDAIALRHNGKSYSYQELNAKANRISWMLIGKGIQSGDHVGLVMSRSFDMIATLLAILKAGAVYVPMEPDYPEARIQAIEESAQLKLVIFDRPTQAANAHHLYLQEENYATFSIENPGLTKDAGELAYIIYTSGSTGKPKGVRIAHHQAVNLISWVNTEFTVTSSDVMLFITSVTFDLSVYDIFGTLAAGGRIVIVEQSQLHNFEALYEIIITEKITFWDSVPSTLNHLVSDLDERQAELLGHHLRLIFLSGDWIPTMLPSAAKHWFPNSEFISLGGATEGTVWSNFYRVSGKVEHLSSIPYGVPIDNNRFYILDAQQQPVVEGVVGELYIGGVGVAYGYQNDPVKTEQAFFDDPFIETNINGERARMYKTGDLGRILPDGNMELHGRTDHQIKLRGYRIELNEIESVLNLHTGIKEALVNVVELEINGKKNQYLVGYIVSKNNNNLETEVLMSYLSQYLPEYMVPKVFVDLEQLPLSVNGKVDRRALPIPEMGMIDEGYLAPETETEKSLCDLWQETLQVERVGIKDNFFLLGGHSLLATKLIAKMNAGFGVTVPFAILLSEANVQSIAQYIDAVSLNDANLDTLAENENVEEGLF